MVTIPGRVEIGVAPERGGHPSLLLPSLLGLVIATAACTPGAVAPHTRFALHQKGSFQALYDPSGRMVRLLQDTNGDGRAEVVIVFGENGKPARGEMDTNADGVIDRLEHFAEDGTLLRLEKVDEGPPPARLTP